MDFRMRQTARQGGSWLWSALATLGLLLGTASPAQAVFVLAFDLDGNPLVSTPEVQVFDNGAGDLNLAVGAITFQGAVGGFALNVATAISKPIIGPVELHLNSVNASSAGSAKVTIIASDTNYPEPVGGASIVSQIGGVVAAGGALGTLSGLQGADILNDLYGMFFFDSAVTFVSHGPFGDGAFSDTKSAGFTGFGGTMSLTEAVTLTHGPGGGVSSFDIHSSVPEPATLALLALGLLGLAGFARRRAL